jgi:hypothetical protein
VAGAEGGGIETAAFMLTTLHRLVVSPLP